LGNLIADSHSILARRRNHFSQLFNVHGANYVRERVIQTAKPLVPNPSAFDVGMAVGKLKGHKSSGMDHIPAELIKQGVEQFALRSINLLILFGIRMNCSRIGRIRSLYFFIGRVMKEIVVADRGITLVPSTYRILSNILLSRLTPYAEEIIAIICVDCDTSGQLLIIYSAFVKYLR
jgi:hypothetical protein